MNGITYTIAEQDTTHIKFNVAGLIKDSGVYVVYDVPPVITSTGVTSTGACRYLTWHAKSSTGTFTINSSNLMNVGYPVDYATLERSYISIASHFEYKVLEQFMLKIDMVSRRYPDTFPKAFSVMELLTFMEACLMSINLFSPFTVFYYKFSNYDNEIDINYNPYGLQTGVPYEWVTLLGNGSMVQALVARGLLEVDISFNYSDQGINIQYNPASEFRSWYDVLVKQYDEAVKQMKLNYWRPAYVGTVPFAMGIPGIVGNLMPALSNAAVGWPWYRYSVGTMGRPL